MLNAVTNFADKIAVQLSGYNSWEIGQVTFGKFIHPDLKRDLEKTLRDPKESLLLKAAIQFCHEFEISSGGMIHIHKEIPPGAGLGGGSSNAATILKFLTAHFKSQLLNSLRVADLESRVQQLALRLGADVPFLYRGGVCAVGGIGEELYPLNQDTEDLFHGYECAILFLDAHVSTKEVFKLLREKFPNPASSPKEDLLLKQFLSVQVKDGDALCHKLSALIENDLENPAIELCPRIAEILKTLGMIEGVSPFMTGSGSSIVVIPSARTAFSAIQRESLRNALFTLKINHFDGSIQVY